MSKEELQQQYEELYDKGKALHYLFWNINSSDRFLKIEKARLKAIEQEAIEPKHSIEQINNVCDYAKLQYIDAVEEEYKNVLFQLMKLEKELGDK